MCIIGMLSVVSDRRNWLAPFKLDKLLELDYHFQLCRIVAGCRYLILSTKLVLAVMLGRTLGAKKGPKESGQMSSPSS